MLAYFKGAGIALFTANLLYLFNVASNIKEIPLRPPFQGIYWYIALYCYLGCILGGILLFYLKQRNSSASLSVIWFALLGILYAFIIGLFLPLGWKLYFVTVIGSVLFYVAQLFTNKILSYSLALSGPILTLIFAI